MAVITTIDGQNRRIRTFAVLVSVWTFLTVVASSAVAPHRASLANLKAMPLTVAGFGFVDFSAFYIGHGWGFLVIGLSLFLLEHMIAEDEPEQEPQ